MSARGLTVRPVAVNQIQVPAIMPSNEQQAPKPDPDGSGGAPCVDQTVGDVADAGDATGAGSSNFTGRQADQQTADQTGDGAEVVRVKEPSAQETGRLMASLPVSQGSRLRV